MQPDTELGPYRIIEPLGAGGMGEVYLAQDTRLGRKVAIKVLPAEFAADPERLARFEQEARAAAALNHPHIAIIHDVGHETDDAGQTTHFMVQEFLEGQDLYALLQSGPLSRSRAIGLGAEIAEALAVAHAAGIVHRDLKPQNIFVSPSGHAKVLDFGLAKLVEPTVASGPRAGAGDAAESPTMLGTMAGVVMGSAGYMAPEQAAGGQIDHRADLFAAGCVLYEMLVGQRAFDGETLIDTLHAVTRSEPAALNPVGSALEPDLRWLLEKCLAKDPESRYQSAGDLAVDLRRLGSASGPSGTTKPELTATATRATTRSWTSVAVAIMALLLGLAAGANLLAPAPDRSVLRLSIPAEFPADDQSTYFAISPDGQTVAYRVGDGGGAGLVLRRSDDFELTPVLRSEGALGPVFSPDSRRLAFFADGGMWVTDVAGGTRRLICDVAQTNSSAVWADDGYIYFVQWATGRGIYRVPERGGVAEEIILPATGDANHRRPRLLPDGSGVAVQVVSATGLASRVYFFDGTASIRVDRDRVAYLRSGRALFVEAGQLFVADYDPETYQIEGEPSLLARGVLDYGVSAAGTLAYRYNEGAAGGGPGADAARMLRYARQGSAELIAAFDGRFQRPVISPDQSMVATNSGNLAGLHVWDVVRGTRRAVAADGYYPQWGPDSNTLYFQSRTDGEGYHIDQLTLDGSVERQRLASTPVSIWPTDVAADGSAILYYQIHPETERDIWVLPLDGREPQPFLVTPASERSGVFSPDGRWVAYLSDTSGREEVYVRPFGGGEGGGREVVVTVDGGREPRWSADGTEIYFRRDDGLWAVPVSTDPTFSVGKPEVLFTGSFDYEEGGQNQQYDVFDNGDFLMIERPNRPEEIRLVVNWLDELEASGR